MQSSTQPFKTPPAALTLRNKREDSFSSISAEEADQIRPGALLGTAVWMNEATNAIVLGSHSSPPGDSWREVPFEDLPALYAEHEFLLSSCREYGQDAAWRFEKVARNWLRSFHNHEQGKEATSLIGMIRHVGVADVFKDENGGHFTGRCILGTIFEETNNWRSAFEKTGLMDTLFHEKGLLGTFIGEKGYFKVSCRYQAPGMCSCPSKKKSETLCSSPCPDEEEKVLAALRVCWQHLNNTPYGSNSNCNICGRVQ